MIPQNTITIESKEDAKKMLKLMDMLEEQDDIQEVYSNYEILDEIIQELEGYFE